MSTEKITNALVDAFSLLDFSEKLLDEIETAPLAELPRIVSMLKKNVRDAKKLISDAEAELDGLVRGLDEQEAKDLLVDMEIEEGRRYEAEIVEALEKHIREVGGGVML